MMERVKWQPDGELLAAVVADDGRGSRCSIGLSAGRTGVLAR